MDWLASPDGPVTTIDWAQVVQIIDTWPAALVALALIFAFLIMPKLSTLLKTVQDIRHEMHPNSGGSLRDAVDRIEKEQKATKDLVESHIEESAADRADLRSLIEKRED